MANTREQLRVWDLPTRSFHWSLATVFVVAMVTAGSDRWLDLHVFAGYALVGLLLFRLLWGFVGGHYARFRAFTFGPRVVAAYLRALRNDRPHHYVGHNPAGAWAVFLMLGLLAAIGLSGIAVQGAEEQQGLIAGWAAVGTGVGLHELHEVLAWAMVALVAVHVTGVAVESWLHRENLVGAMVHGRKPRRGGVPPTPPHRLIGLALPLLLIAAAVLYFRPAYTQDSEHPYRPFTGPALPQDATWREECSACHLAFHPSLLPARSWQRMFDGQADHFGEDLALADATVAHLRRFAAANAAERGADEAAWRIGHSLAPDAAPLRITDTPYWRAKHREIAAAVWRRPNVRSKANCAACHRDAQAGTFNDAAMAIPPAP